MTCLFCRIAAGEIPATKVHESDRLVAFLDIHPIRPGHVLIIPRAHHDVFDQLPADLMAEITGLGQSIARAQKALYGVERVGFAFTGTDVAHVHAHVVPMVARDDLTSRRYIAEEVVTYALPPSPAPEALAETARQLREGIAAAS